VALKGTLKDFGIAEILQLIGQQAKSGVLHLETKGEEVHVRMSDGCVVSAEWAGRRQRDRLGAMLVRAELVSQADLEQVLEGQRRSLRRLGDLLVERKLVSRESLRTITALQTTDTLYRLFAWKSGTYEFEPGLVQWDRETVTPLGAEAVLMEGFRQLDEWPLVRAKIPSPAATFRRVGGDPGAEALGEGERRVLELIAPDRDVDKIAALAFMGEFDVSKALLTLVNLGLIEVVPPARPSGVGAYARSWRKLLRERAGRLVATLALAALLGTLALLATEKGIARGAGGLATRDRAVQRYLGRAALARLEGALEVWRLEHGEYPDDLRALAEAGLVERNDLRYPYSEQYYYRRRAKGGYALLPPLP
jgi:hypothetical protein